MGSEYYSSFGPSGHPQPQPGPGPEINDRWKMTGRREGGKDYSMVLISEGISEIGAIV